MPTNPSIPTHSVRAAAAAYIEMGMIPVPVPVRRKGPVVADWPDLRFTPADLSDWFPDDRTGNVGLNLVVNLADMDLDSAEAVAAGNRWLPWTGWVSGRTNKPRSHHWYRPAGPVRYLEFNDVDGSRILELRTGAGLQTVVPPGIHELGDEIVWHTFDGDPAVVPGADLMRLAGEVAALSILIRHWPVKGNRDNAHLGLIGGLLRAGWTVSRVEALVAAVADLTDDEEARRRVAKVARSEERLKSNDPTRGWPTLERCLTGDGAEVVKRVRTWLNLAVEASGGQAEPAAEPWAPPVPLGDVPNVAPFPADVFPPAVADFAGHVAASMNCPFDYVAAGVLGIAGAALGAARRLEVKPGFAVLPNLYIAPVAPPGSAKSPAQTAVVKPLVEIDADLDRASREARREYRLALEDYKDDLKEWRKKKEGPRPVEPELPDEKRAVVGDITSERFRGLLAMNPKGLIREEDELTALVKSMDAYRSGKGGDRQFYLSGWNGRLPPTDRQRDKAEGVGGVRNPLACISVLGSLTPDNLFLFKGDERRGRAVEDGFYDRFLFCFPAPYPDAEEDWASVPAEQADRWARVVRRLRDLELAADRRDEAVTYQPVAVRLTPDARQAWKEFTRAHAAARNAADFPAHLRGVWSKLKGYCPRLALVVHGLRWACGEIPDDRADVDAESVRRAVVLVGYFKSHARKVAAAIDLDPQVEDAKTLLAWIEKYVRMIAPEKKLPADRFQLRTAFEGTKGTLDNMDRLTRAVGVLAQHGYVRPVPVAKRGPGNPPSPWYLIHPDLGPGSQNSQNPGPDPGDGGPGPGTDSHNSPNSGPGRRAGDPRPVFEPTPPAGESGGSANCASHSEGDGSASDRSGPSSANCTNHSWIGGPWFGSPTGSSANCANHFPGSDSESSPAGSSANCANRFRESELHAGDEIGISEFESDSQYSHNSVPGVAGDDSSLETGSHNSQNSLPTGVFPGASATAGNPGHRFMLVRSPGELDVVVSAVEESAVVGVDLETTGLNPRSDRVRLVAVNCDTNGGGRFTYLVDAFAVDPAPLLAALADAELVIHNAAFDLGFLAKVGFVPGKVHDTLLLSQVLYASARTKGAAPVRHGLKECCERELGVTLAKDLQTSDWSGRLSQGQYYYAAADADVLVPLFRLLTEKLGAAGLTQTATIETGALPAIARMATAGVPFDRAAWQALADGAAADAQRLAADLNAAAPAKPEGLFDGRWNWDSPEQVRDALALAGCELKSTRDDELAGADHPLAALLRDYRDASKRKTTYGADWLKHVATDGRIYPRWVQLGANSGRMACKEPNMQNLPRGKYRKCVVARPGHLLVKADYSQIELRIAAKVSGDKALIAAYDRGEDLHTLTARNVLGIAEVTKEHRQLAKAINFGLLYGMGAKTFRAYAKANYGVEMAEEQASAYREAFFRAYTGLRRWHRSVGDKAKDTRTLAGRRVLRVERFTEKLNLPVQGTGADGLKLALGLLWARRHDCPSAMPVLAVHDEIVVECPADDSDAAKVWLRSAMIDAMAPLVAPVPVEVEVKAGRTWGGD